MNSSLGVSTSQLVFAVCLEEASHRSIYHENSVGKLRGLIRSFSFPGGRDQKDEIRHNSLRKQQAALDTETTVELNKTNLIIAINPIHPKTVLA